MGRQAVCPGICVLSCHLRGRAKSRICQPSEAKQPPQNT
ncbi:unnamed protein product [Gulo gulo]|uniref:Uncharacterized protein n=1 Tax=Gulo gulo TaxID=48420 RepID=A0A9X9MBP2_GULGU|nr:unnamed protein product [Gulo gulo]